MTRFRRTLAGVVLALSAVASAAEPPAQAPSPARASPRKLLIQQAHFHAGHALTAVPAGGRSPGAQTARATGSASRTAVRGQLAPAGVRGVVGWHSAGSVGGAASARARASAVIDGTTIRRRAPR